MVRARASLGGRVDIDSDPQTHCHSAVYRAALGKDTPHLSQVNHDLLAHSMRGAAAATQRSAIACRTASEEISAERGVRDPVGLGLDHWSPVVVRCIMVRERGKGFTMLPIACRAHRIIATSRLYRRHYHPRLPPVEDEIVGSLDETSRFTIRRL